MRLPLHVLLSWTALVPLAALAPFAASAADYDPPMVVEQAEEFVPVEIGSGWYLRGDVGYIFSSDIGGVDYTTFDAGTRTFSAASFSSSGLDTDFSWGGGVGYRFTDYLRADATIDSFKADFDGATTSSEPCVAAPVDDTSCRSSNSSRASVLSVMANGYVDLGTFVGFTPYVGVGAGASYVSWKGLNDSTYCVGEDCAPTIDPVDSTGHGGTDGWRMTYALMAGVAYDVSKNFKVDLGYRYRSIDGGDMFGWDSPRTFGDGKHGSIDTHEVKLGLRYEIW